MPNAAKAVEHMLGRVRGDVVRNRTTPLFLLYSSTGQDFLNVASPQAAMAFNRFTAASYTSPPAGLPQGEEIRSYREFPNSAVTTAPRASAYVLATDTPPSSGHPVPVALYWLDRAQPLSGFPNHRDSLLMTSTAHVEFAVSQGYTFRGVQGYVYPPCPGDSCMPVGTQILYRKCNTAKDDCAVFLEYQKTAFEAKGYIAPYPAGSTTIGYAYPPVDSDGDGLVDGMEHIIGTDINNEDSDDDDVCDGMEFPQAGVAISDPCTESANNTCARPPNTIFANGFE
jgi:serine protease